MLEVRSYSIDRRVHVLITVLKGPAWAIYDPLIRNLESIDTMQIMFGSGTSKML